MCIWQTSGDLIRFDLFYSQQREYFLIVIKTRGENISAMSIQSNFSHFGSDDLIDLVDPTIPSNDNYEGNVDLIGYEDDAPFEDVDNNDNEGDWQKQEQEDSVVLTWLYLLDTNHLYKLYNASCVMLSIPSLKLHFSRHLICFGINTMLVC